MRLTNSADTQKIPIKNALTKLEQLFDDFVFIKDKAIAYYDSLDQTSRNAVVATLNNWNSLNANLAHMVQRTNALLAIVALLFAAVWWLYLKVQWLSTMVEQKHR